MPCSRCHSSFPNLDTHDDVTIPLDGTGRFSRPGIREVSEFFCKGRVKSQARDMHESQNSNRSLINGVLAEVGEIGKATRSGVDRCSDSMVQRNVRIDAIDASLKPMAVEVHQTGANIPPLEIQNLALSPESSSVPNSRILPALIPTSRMPSMAWEGSMTWPFLSSRSYFMVAEE